MKFSGIRLFSSTLLASASLALIAANVQAQFLPQNRNVEPRGPFISRSQVSGGLARDHIIEIGIVDVSLTGLTIECFNLSDASGVVVRNSAGEIISENVTIEPTKITISFAAPVDPEENLVVSIEDIDFVQDGNATFYFVSATTPDTGETLVPVGSARILAPARGSDS